MIRSACISLRTQSIHLPLGLPFGLFPGTLMSTTAHSSSFSSILSMCSYQRSLISLTFSCILVTPSSFLMSTLFTLYIHTYIHTYVCMYERVYVRINVCSHIFIYILTLFFLFVLRNVAAVTCGAPPQPVHTLVVESGEGISGTADYDCEKGYQLTSGTTRSSCTAQGLWTDVTIKCQRESVS